MFMLTHTYFLQKILDQSGMMTGEPDIYVYNIAPDLLTIHPNISSARTHILKRSLKMPLQYAKSAYVMYHLMVDDLSHHGYISSGEQEEFKPDSKGYCYQKGKNLVDSLLDVHKLSGVELSYPEAVYRSHLVIEMIYDLIIVDHINAYRTINLLVHALDFTLKNKMKEFVQTIHWLYGLDKNEINEVMEGAYLFITEQSMQRLMTIEGRINLYKEKFGLKGNEKLFYDGLRDLFQRAIDLIDDDEIFFQETVQVIRNCGTLPFLK